MGLVEAMEVLQLIAGEAPESLQEFLPPCELLLGVVTLTSMDALDEFPTFIEADNINGIKIFYEESKKNISIGTLPKLSNFEVDEVARKQLESLRFSTVPRTATLGGL